MYLLTAEVKRDAESLGSRWFSPDSMGWFGSRIGKEVYAGRYFISSEQDTSAGYRAWNGERRWTIREFEFRDGIFVIGEVGDFGQYRTRADALKAVREIVKAA